MISVVLLTKNGGDLLRRVLNAICHQDAPQEVEIVAVDSGSSDETLRILADVGARVHTIPGNSFRFGPTRQFAFALSRGDYIVTMSQDVLPMDDSFLATLVGPLIAGEAEVVQGRTMPQDDPSIFYWERQRAFYFTGEGKDFFRWSGNAWLSCCALAITREAWRGTGFGNSPYCEDKYLQRQIVESGLRIRMIHEPIAWHGHSYTLASLAKRCLNEGVGWRHASVVYPVRQLALDLLCPPWQLRKTIATGLRQHVWRDPASLLFFQLRPLFLFVGNRMYRRCWM